MDFSWMFVPATAIVGTAANAVLLYFWQPWAKALAEETGKLDAREAKLDAILAEAKAVTAATKLIESQLAGDLWHKQTLWNEKKLVYGGMLMAIHQLLASINDMRACVDTNGPITDELRTNLNIRLKEATMTFLVAEREMLRQTRLAGIFAQPKCYEYLKTVLNAPRGEDWREPQRLKEHFVKLCGIDEQLMRYAQDDLGITKVEHPST